MTTVLHDLDVGAIRRRFSSLQDGFAFFDEYRWHNEMRKEAELLSAKGTVARYTVEKGQPHRIETLAGTNASRLFDGFEETKNGCRR